MGADTFAVAIMNYVDGSPGDINQYVGHYGTGKPIKLGDAITGVVRLQLRAGPAFHPLAQPQDS